MISYDPEVERLISEVIYTDRLAFVVSPAHRFAKLKNVSITGLGMETVIAHHVSPLYRNVELRGFKRHKVPLNMDVEMPRVESIRNLVQRNEGVAFLPRMYVEQKLEQKSLREVKVDELEVDRKIRLVYPARRELSHAAKAFLEVVRSE